MTARARLGRLRLLRWIYLAVVAIVVVWLLGSRRQEIADLAHGCRLGVAGAALLLALGQFGLGALFWTRALRSLGQPVAWRTVLDASAKSVLARYVPGSVWYAVSRGGLLWLQGASVAAVAAVAVLENVLSILVVFALGPTLQAIGGGLPGIPRWPLALAPVLLVLASPPILNRLLRLLGGRTGAAAACLSWRRYLELGGWMTLFWCWSATTFTVYLHSFPGLRTASPIFVAGAFMVAWGAGFLAIFAPQGIGVFELALAALLSGEPWLDLALIAAGYRILMLIRDVALALLASLGRPAPPRRSEGSLPEP